MIPADVGVVAFLAMSGTLVILRHGQSEWNLANLFTGWHDVALTELGIAEAGAAGVTMRDAGIEFDTSHTSLQTRAVETQNHALAAMGQSWLPVERNWRLNERHYGSLQGLDKKETTAAARGRPGVRLAAELRRAAAARRARQPGAPGQRSPIPTPTT